nr:DDE-type integrase/transposase/recombinase [Anaerostipes faecis]
MFRGGRSSEKTARIIHSLRGDFKLKDILAVVGFPKATYMYWQKRFQRDNPNKELEEKIMEITSFTRKSRKYSSYKGRIGKVAPNRLRRRFDTKIPHQKITTDTTEFKYYDVDPKGRMMIKKLYLYPFMDLCNREIISYGVSRTPSSKNIMNALNAAIEITSDCPYRRTFHSDQGRGYQMKAYVRTLQEHRIFQSISRKGNCHDNSVMENFFGIMKQEMYLGWLSPVEYRLSLLAA